MNYASHLELIVLKFKSVWLVGHGEKNILRILYGKPVTMWKLRRVTRRWYLRD